MIVFPAIDLIDGKVVRLARGARDAMDVYDTDPVAVAGRFAAAGATWVHVVDLSAAFGEDADACERNARAIRAICARGDLSVDVGGGVRDMRRVDRLVEAGAARIAIGTALVRDPTFAQEAVRAYGEVLVADVAARNGTVRVNGWRDEANLSLATVVGNLTAYGYRHLVFTDVERDGMQVGIDVAAYRDVAALAGFPVVASGGIASLDDVARLALHGGEALEGCIIGRALYEGVFTLEEALDVAASPS